jgi:hypothetical protein
MAIVREFFKPLRRKIGVVTLVVACCFLAAWIRSTVVGDSLKLHFGKQRQCGISSQGQSIHFGVTADVTDDPPMSNLEMTRWPMAHMPEFYKNESLKFSISIGDDSTWVVIVPHWSIVIPLTLLSAWLLLSKVRPKQNAPSQAPAENR